MPVFHCSAILFDLDGVLCDSTQAVDREWREWASRKGVDGDAVMAIAHGVRTIEVIRRVAPHLDAEAESAAIENHEAHDQRGVTVMPGALNLVNSIPSGQWGVVTSGSRLLARNRLRHCGLPIPDVLVTSDDVVNGKPHPEPYLKGASGLNFSPADCLVIEDAPAGIQAARAAGMKVLGITSTYSAQQLGEADAIIETLQSMSVEIAKGSLMLSTHSLSPGQDDVTVRAAAASDTSALVSLVNSAFAIEKFLKGERTDERQLREMMQKGQFLLGCDGSGKMMASVYVEVRGPRGYFGMLSVDPKYQGNGLGTKMVRAAEEYCRRKGCTAMDLTVLSLRSELPPLYRKLGYLETGVEEFHPGRELLGVKDCHCIIMSKML
jgi:mannitol-1-/sugar-/sorbitol-6-phosphatase